MNPKKCRLFVPAEQPKQGAFTLVELMVSIGIITVLIGLMLPALSGASRAGTRTLLLTNQRESMRVVEEYAADHDQRYPSAGDESGLTASWEWQGSVHREDYWAQPEHWGWYVQSQGYNGYVSLGPDATPASFDVGEGCTDCGLGVRSLHVLSPTVLALPEMFHDGAVADRALNTPRRTADVTSPAAKGVLYQLYFTSLQRRERGQNLSLVHFADGHGAHLPEDALAPGVSGEILYAGLPVLATRDGVRGRDLR